MEIKKFGLGIRFELNKTGAACESRVNAAENFVLSKLFEILTVKDVENINLYAGEYKLTPSDADGIFTVVLTEGSHKRMSGIYGKIVLNNELSQYLTSYLPFIQTNLLRKAEGLAYYGKFDKNGVLTGGNINQSFTVSEKYKATNNKPCSSDKPCSNNKPMSGNKCRNDRQGIKLVLAPDKFKGSMTAETASNLLAAAARESFPNADIIKLPTADGGDGTVDALIRARGGKKRIADVTAPIGEKKVAAEYGMLYGDTAVIEMAEASGLALLNEEEKNPLKATSRGTGELILRALDEGAQHIMIGIGGSATDDGGMGAAAALGAKFLDSKGNELRGCGADMQRVEKIELSGLDKRLGKIDITVLCDVDNPLTGANGATYVYAKQKGADEEMLEILEAGMKNIERLYNSAAGFNTCSLPGSGAAGGMGAMLTALMNAKLVSGAEAILNAIGFDRMIKGADLVVTGEGMLDKTSVENGKAVGTVVRAAKAAKVPSAIIAGCFGSGYESIYEIDGGVKVFAVSDKKIARQEFKDGAEERFFEAAKAMFRSIAEEMKL